jgi:hypothetical protein
MATTNYLHHALGLLRYEHLSTEFRGGTVYYHVIRKRTSEDVLVVVLGGIS